MGSGSAGGVGKATGAGADSGGGEMLRNDAGAGMLAGKEKGIGWGCGWGPVRSECGTGGAGGGGGTRFARLKVGSSRGGCDGWRLERGALEQGFPRDRRLYGGRYGCLDTVEDRHFRCCGGLPGTGKIGTMGA